MLFYQFSHYTLPYTNILLYDRPAAGLSEPHTAQLVVEQGAPALDGLGALRQLHLQAVLIRLVPVEGERGRGEPIRPYKSLMATRKRRAKADF